MSEIVFFHREEKLESPGMFHTWIEEGLGLTRDECIYLAKFLFNNKPINSESHPEFHKLRNEIFEFIGHVEAYKILADGK